MNWMGCRRMAWAGVVAAMVVLVAGCASGPPSNDLVTDSDQTKADRAAQLHMELAAAYFGRGNNEAALDDVKKVLAAKPDSSAAYNLRGLIYASMDQNDLAESSFQRAMQINPRDFDAAHNYAWFLCQKRRYDDADAEFAKLLAQPSYRDIVRTQLARGVCLARNQRWGDAEQALRRAYELDPANPAVAVNLTEVLYREQQYERARFYIRRVNAVDELVTSQTLWLAMRIERKLGRDDQVQQLGTQLRNRFPDASETLLYEKGRFDD